MNIDDPFSAAIRELEVHNQKIDETLFKTTTSDTTTPRINNNKKIIRIFNNNTNHPQEQQQQHVMQATVPDISTTTPEKNVFRNNNNNNNHSIRIIKLNTTNDLSNLINYRSQNTTPPRPTIPFQSTSPSTNTLNSTQIKVINLKNNNIKISTLNDYYSQQPKQQQQQQQQQKQPTIIQIPKKLTSIKELTQRSRSEIIFNNSQNGCNGVGGGIQITKVVSSRGGGLLNGLSIALSSSSNKQQQHQQQPQSISAPLLRLCSGGNNNNNNNSNGHHQLPAAANLQDYLTKSNQIQQNNNEHHHQQHIYKEQDEEVVVDEDEELGHAETYADYMPSKLKIGLRHPDPVVETSSLASVEPPEVWYKLKMPEHVYDDGALSALQLEAIVYASQKHETFLPNNHRAGFLIGDGAGVGKGRTIAGILYENYLLGRKKSLWLSVSNDLKYDAQRDLNDIGAHRIDVHALNKLKYCKINSKLNSKIKKGVIFATYPSLIGESQNSNTKKKYNTRLKQLLQWLGDDFDGVIVFDECHKAKNLVPVGSAKPTKTGLAVLELQEKLPNARIIYASATGASEPKNMAYMVRLGLWGPGTPFNDFNEFIQCIEKRGVGAMEIVAMDMKLRGMYMARQLSFSGVTFKIQEIKLTDEYIQMYNDSVKLWVLMKEKFQEALELVDTDGRLRKTIWGQFWSAHQRFFKYLCMASKVSHVVDLARNALHSSKCVVIGLQSTGESRTIEQLDEMNGELSEFVSTARGVLQNLIDKHFPTTASGAVASNGDNNGASLNQQNKQSFLDILGVGDHIREQLNTNKSKESKNSKKVNEILKRLSSYTNQNPVNAKQQQNKNGSDSSASNSASNSGDSSSDEDESSNSNTTKRTKKNIQNDKSEKEVDDEEDEEADDGVDYDDQEEEEDDDDCEEEDSEGETEEDEQQQQNESKPVEIKIKNNDSDDSDSLFSIVRTSVSLCNANQTILKKKFRKKRKKILIEKSVSCENEQNLMPEAIKMEEEKIARKEADIDDDVIVLPAAKRIKIEEKVPINKEELFRTRNANQIQQYLVESKNELFENLKSISKLLPPNTLDELIDNLDGPKYVAEMTGRKGRVVTNSDGNILYEARNESDNVPIELLNIVQKEQFLNGEKLIAIISEAASSGISLQANRRNVNQRRRVHITIELPWSADRAIQQFGRTHRSNQVSAPEYIFLISELAGEKRFASTVAKRLESLGALTHGDRRATETRDLSRFNIDNKYGRVALENVIKSICGIEKPLAKIPSCYVGDNFFADARTALNGVGMINISINSKNTQAFPDKDYTNINKFLNRLLGCPVNLQNAIFSYFSDVLAAVILDAKRTGKWDMGILDIGGNNSYECVFRTKTKYYCLNNKLICNATSCSTNKITEEMRRVELHTVIVERGLAWEKAIELAANLKEPQGFYVSNQVKNNHRIAILAVNSKSLKKLNCLNGNIDDSNLTSFCIYKPNTGLQVRQETLETLNKKYKKVSYVA